MKQTKTVEVLSCDLCGVNIEKKQFEINDATVVHHAGVDSPDGSGGVTTEFDLCGKCFLDRLVPWLKSQGAEPMTTDWDG